MRHFHCGAFVLCISAALVAACSEEQPADDDADLAEATAMAQEMDIEANAVARAAADSLAGRWNLRPNDVMAFYGGIEMITGTGGGGSIDPPDVLETLCTERELCFDTTIATSFVQGTSGVAMTRYTMNPDEGPTGLNGILVHRLGVAAFNVGADYLAYDGVYVDAVAGYASQLGMTPTRPEIDEDFSGSYDGVILLEIGAAANIAAFVVPAGGAVIMIPFDAVGCELHPDDCTR